MHQRPFRGADPLPATCFVFGSLLRPLAALCVPQLSKHSSTRIAGRNGNVRTEARRSAATLAISTIMSLVLLEAAFRIWQGVPLLDTTNFRNLRMVSGALVGATYDPALGWTLAP